MKNITIIFFISWILSFLLASLRGGISIGELQGFSLGFLFSFLAYYSITYIFLLRNRNKIHDLYIYLAILVGCILIDLPFRIMVFREVLISLPDMIGRILAVSLAFLGYKSIGLWKKLLNGILSLSFVLWFTYQGYDFWIHKLNYGTFTEVTAQQLLPFTFFDSENNIISVDDFADKYILLDFWFTGCPSCRKQFPEIQKVYDMYIENPLVEIYSIHCYQTSYQENYTTGENILKGIGYTYPSFALDITAPQLKEIGIISYPIILIINPSGTIIYKGNLKEAFNILKKSV